MTFVCSKRTGMVVQIPKACEVKRKNEYWPECSGCKGPIEEGRTITREQANKTITRSKHIKPLRYHDHIREILSGPARKHRGTVGGIKNEM